MRRSFSTVFFALWLGSFACALAADKATVTPFPDDPAATEVDRKYMARANELVRDSVAHNQSPFSAILVKDGKVLAEFQNTESTTHDITKHAETGLISLMTPKLDRATLAASTLYASTEPCTMCCGAIRFAGIGRLVYGVTSTQLTRSRGLPLPPNPLACREIFTRTSPEVKVIGPLMEAEGLELHAAFRARQNKM
jgi:tRNA(Arg) A34 adenosine deaminase TadA